MVRSRPCLGVLASLLAVAGGCSSSDATSSTDNTGPDATGDAAGGSPTDRGADHSAAEGGAASDAKAESASSSDSGGVMAETGPVVYAGSCRDADVDQAAPMGAWKNVTSNLAGMMSECGNLSFLSSKPDQDMLIAGVAQHGLFASTDGGASWSAIGMGASSDPITNRTSSIVYDPAHTGTFWESGIYNSGGVYRTTDNGNTFTKLGDATHDDLVGIDFTDPQRQTMLAGGHEQSARLLKSTDGGASWTDIGAKLPANIGFSVAPVVIDAMTFVLGTTFTFSAGAMPGIFRSTDGGDNWMRVSSSPIRGAPLLASDSAIYWAVDNNGGLLRSNDHGVTWGLTVGQGTLSTRTPIELPDGRIVAVGPDTLMISPDCGTSWHPASTKLPYQPDNIAYSPYQKAFFIRHFDCNNPVPQDAIERFDFDYTTE